MDPAFLAIQALNGLASASSLFITACGLTIVFGVTRIVNFAHGSLYMLGAYFAATLVPRLLALSPGPLGFWTGILAAALAVGLLGVLLEVLLLRRIYRVPELFQLLATFGVVLVVQDLVVQIFGPEDILGPRAPGLRAPVEILGRRFPSYELVLIAAGPLVLGLVWLLLRRTRFGVLVRAATQDREMVAALGVNQAVLFTGTLFLGAFLAGLGGALQIPARAGPYGHGSLDHRRGFVVTVVGGMGSVPGAFLAALVIGQLQAFGILIFPKITLVVVFLLMAFVLVVRPYGLFGRPETLGGAHAVGIASRPAAPRSPARRACRGGAPRAPAARRRRLSPEGRDRDPRLRALRLQPAAAHRRRRSRELRTCGLFRPRRLWGGARASGGSARPWRRRCPWRRSWPPPARPSSGPSSSACPASISPC